MTFWGIDVQSNLSFPIYRGREFCVKINRCQILLSAKKPRGKQSNENEKITYDNIGKLIPQVLDKIGSAVLLLALKEMLTAVCTM